MNIIIRKAELRDIPAIAEIEAQSFPDPWTEAGLSDALSGGDIFLAAFAGDIPVGYIIGNDCGTDGYIEKVAVKQDFRRAKIGSALINEFENALSEGCSFISLEVRSSNEAAISAYEKTGFENAGIRKNFYSAPRENAFVLIKQIGKGTG